MIRGFLFSMCIFGTTASLVADTISTGAQSWLVNSSPAAITTTQSNYFAPFGDGNWIGVTPSGFAPPGTYVFTLEIGTLIATSGTFSLSYGADNSVTWTITNGSLSGTLSCLNPSGDCSGPGASPTLVPASLSGTFNANSILTATVVNDGGTANPMALFAAGSATAVPEPSTVVLFLVIVPLMFRRMRRI
jgi:hypothetical protein